MNYAKKGVSKKIFLLLLLIVGLGLLINSQLAFLEFRYQPKDFSNAIVTSSHYPFAFKRKKVAGATMQYCQLGTGDHLPVIVFVHGSPGSLAAYETYLKDSLLYRQAILIAVDRLGFGYSDFGKTIPSLQLQAKLIASILADFPNSKKVLVGHSMGGPVNSRLAMDYPNLVDGMILVAPSISPALEPSNWWRKLLNFPIIRWLTPPALRVCNQEIIPLKEELLAMESRWKNITCPVTIIQGTADQLVPAGNAQYAKEQLTNSKAVKLQMVKEGNHFILWSEVSLIREAILEMLKSIE